VRTGRFGIAFVWQAGLRMKAKVQAFSKTIRTVVLVSLLAVGLFLAIKRFYPRAGMRSPPNIKSSRSLISNAMYLPESRVFSSEIDTSVLKSVAGQYNVLVIVRVPDNWIDSLDDTKIAKSDAVAITGEVRTIQIDLTEQFIQRANEAKKRFEGQPVEGFVGHSQEHKAYSNSDLT
jgi:hypothetical protein